ncbi:VOC family protein [Hyphococcus flavus]|uniref:VOC family protein n=1 Tax=Hyphococcus flavus TaxID=1866326 RepID=A0AAF0CFS6_9PROT|nr:VOC family protein [Hyphococcus flavus]WDI31694.1 VOC family protein [Hyphococcus flavus]
MSLNTYLTFDGNCGEAFDFYKSVFGGEFMMRSTFAEGPPDMGVSNQYKNRIMHVSLPIGSSMLMGSDTAGEASGPFVQGTNFSISYAPSSKADADEKFLKLSAGGMEIMAMQDVFWGSYFGMCIDKFGIRWMLNMPTGDAA